MAVHYTFPCQSTAGWSWRHEHSDNFDISYKDIVRRFAPPGCNCPMRHVEMHFDYGILQTLSVSTWLDQVAYDIVCGNRHDSVSGLQGLKFFTCLFMRKWPIVHGELRVLIRHSGCFLFITQRLNRQSQCDVCCSWTNTHLKQCMTQFKPSCVTLRR